MKKKMMRIIAMCLVASALLSASAFALRDEIKEDSSNGISVKVAASAWTNAAGTYAWCNSASKVYAVITVYNTNNCPVGSDVKSGTTDAMAEYDATVAEAPATATGLGYATINGTTKYGPTLTVAFS